MASVTEIFGSRNGARRGVSGVVAPRRFDVVVDVDNDDPITVLAENGVQSGQPYAWGDFLAFAQNFTVEAQRTRRMFRVSVEYTTPIAFTPLKSAFPDWIVQFRGVSFPEHINIEPEALTARIPPRVIGAIQYIEDPDGDFISNGVRLRSLGEESRLKEGFDVEIPMVALILRRQLTSFTFAAGISLPFYTKKANSIAWHGIPARLAYFDDVIVDERFGVPADAARTRSNQESVFYDLQLSFLIRATEWTPVPSHHFHEDPETGKEHVVNTLEVGSSGEPVRVVDPIVKYATVDFSRIFSLIENLLIQGPSPIPTRAP